MRRHRRTPVTPVGSSTSTTWTTPPTAWYVEWKDPYRVTIYPPFRSNTAEN